MGIPRISRRCSSRRVDFESIERAEFLFRFRCLCFFFFLWWSFCFCFEFSFPFFSTAIPPGGTTWSLGTTDEDDFASIPLFRGRITIWFDRIACGLSGLCQCGGSVKDYTDQDLITRVVFFWWYLSVLCVHIFFDQFFVACRTIFPKMRYATRISQYGYTPRITRELWDTL